MATTSDVRQWAAANGHETGSKGRLPARVTDAYNAGHPDDPYEAETARAVLPGDDDDELAAAYADPPGATGETAPRRPPAGGGRKRGAGLGGLLGGGGKAPRERRPRVSTEALCAGLWRGIAGIAKPLPPLYRTMRIQAPVAGALLEDTLRDSPLDAIAQPLARLAQGSRAAGALLGPPAIVGFLTVYGQQCAAQKVMPNPVIWSAGEQALREALMIWAEVAGPKFEEIVQREKDFEESHGQTVDMMMKYLFSDVADAEEEERQIRRAQGMQDEPVAP